MRKFSCTDIAAKQDQQAATCDTSVPQPPQTASESVNGNDKYLPMCAPLIWSFVGLEHTACAKHLLSTPGTDVSMKDEVEWVHYKGGGSGYTIKGVGVGTL